MSSAQVPQDRTDKIATDERHAWPRKVTLDARLRVFTADRTNEPRVVRLFPRESCSNRARRGRAAITLPQHDWLSVYPTVVGLHGVRWTSLAVTSNVARTRRPGGSIRGPATSISCLQVTSMGTWQRRWLPPLWRTSSSSSRRHLQLLRTWNQAARRRQVHLYQRSGRQRLQDDVVCGLRCVWSWWSAAAQAQRR